MTMTKILSLEKKSKNGTNRQEGKFEIKNVTEDSADLYMYGYIADDKWWDDDIVPQDVKEFLDQVKDVKTLNIYINSGGGSVFAGMAIYNMLNRMNAYTTVYVDGLAASIASVIAFCGDKLVIPSNAYLMIHKPLMMAYGNANDLLEAADVLDKIEEGILNVYKTKVNDDVDVETIKKFVDEETWFTGEDAAKYFDIDVVAANKAVAYCAIEGYKNAPTKITNSTNKELEIEKAKLKLACEMSI